MINKNTPSGFLLFLHSSQNSAMPVLWLDCCDIPCPHRKPNSKISSKNSISGSCDAQTVDVNLISAEQIELKTIPSSLLSPFGYVGISASCFPYSSQLGFNQIIVLFPDTGPTPAFPQNGHTQFMYNGGQNTRN